MQLIYAEAVALVLGLAVGAVLRHRELTGALLLPAVAGSAGAITWTALTWAGAPDGGPAMWLASLLAAIVSAAVVGTVVVRARTRADAERLAAA